MDTESTIKTKTIEEEWKHNKIICSGCVKRILNDGQKLGCKHCDENWDCPELIYYSNNK